MNMKVAFKMQIIAFTLLLLNVFSQKITAQTVPFRIKSQWGLADGSGKLLSKVQYDSIEFFSAERKGGRAWKNEKVGIINHKGKEVIKPTYSAIVDLFEYYEVFMDKKLGIFSYDGIQLLPIAYDAMQLGSQGFILLTQNNKMGIARYLDNKITFMKPCMYDKIDLLSENLFKCTFGSEMVYLDTLMNEIKNYKPVTRMMMTEMDFIAPPAPFAYSNDPDKNREFLVNEEDKYTNRFSHNQDITLYRDSIQFDVVYERINGKWGARKTNGKLLVPYKYEDINLTITDMQSMNTPCLELYAFKLNGKWGMIGHKNEAYYHYNDTTTYNLLPFEYDKIASSINRTFYLVTKNNWVGIANLSKPESGLKPKYKCIYSYHHELISSLAATNNETSPKIIFSVITANNKFGYVSENGLEYFKDE
jgi:hypothetical protein